MTKVAKQLIVIFIVVLLLAACQPYEVCHHYEECPECGENAFVPVPDVYSLKDGVVYQLHECDCCSYMCWYNSSKN